MFAKQGKYEEALRSLAQDAYYCSLGAGPEDLTTASAYFLLGDVFSAKVRVRSLCSRSSNLRLLC